MNKKQRKKENRIPSIVSTGYPSYVYRGEIKYGKPHGKGEIKFTGPLLSIKPQAVILDHEYEGEFKKGKKDGMGTYTNYHTGFYFNKYEYVGEFKDGKREGEGTWSLYDGTTYAGEWKHDKFHGRGTLNYLGNIQDGYWHKGACECEIGDELNVENQ